MWGTLYGLYKCIWVGNYFFLHQNVIFVYQMGRLCGGAHEISGIKTPIFLCGWEGVVVWCGGVVKIW